jgi:hypothetical protein
MTVEDRLAQLEVRMWVRPALGMPVLPVALGMPVLPVAMGMPVLPVAHRPAVDTPALAVMDKPQQRGPPDQPAL